jgi:hypothetical protein
MRIKVKDAAKRLGMPEQTLRLWCQSKNCPFGTVIIEGKGRKTYYINGERLNNYLNGGNTNVSEHEAVNVGVNHSD